MKKINVIEEGLEDCDSWVSEWDNWDYYDDHNYYDYYCDFNFSKYSVTNLNVNNNRIYIELSKIGSFIPISLCEFNFPDSCYLIFKFNKNIQIDINAVNDKYGASQAVGRRSPALIQMIIWLSLKTTK